MNMDFVTVGAIIVICYLVAYIVKTLGNIDKWIPAICGISGLVLGILGFYIMPDFPANDLLTAMAVGVSSGFAATGVNQVYKQLKKGGGN